MATRKKRVQQIDMAEDTAVRHWHLDKRVNVGHILTTLALALAAFTWGSAIERRVAVLDTAIQTIARDNEKQDQALKDATHLTRQDLREVKDELRDISRKLDDRLNRGNR